MAVHREYVRHNRTPFLSSHPQFQQEIDLYTGKEQQKKGTIMRSAQRKLFGMELPRGHGHKGKISSKMSLLYDELTGRQPRKRRAKLPGFPAASASLLAEHEQAPLSIKRAHIRPQAILVGVVGSGPYAKLIVERLLQMQHQVVTTSKEASSAVVRLVELSTDQAEQLDGVKDVFTIEVIGTRADSKYQPGQIVEQDPSAGRTRKGNLVIRVYVCAEEEKYMVPDVRNQTLQEAKLELNNMNLSLQIETSEEFSDTVAEGSVISTSPSVGSEIKKGNTVILTVSKGPEQKNVTVPSFLTMTEENAAQQANNLGLTVGQLKYVHNSAPAGQVIGQSIANGTTVASGTEITFTVSKGAEPTDTTVSKDVSFIVPNDLPSDTTIEVTFYQDGKAVGSKSISTDDDSVSFTFTGTSGTTAHVEAHFGDKTSSKEITF